MSSGDALNIIPHLYQAMLWLLIALAVVCASGVAALMTACCCHKLAICILGSTVDEISEYQTRVRKVQIDKGQDCEVQMSDIAHVQQPAGEMVLGVPSEKPFNGRQPKIDFVQTK